MTTFTSAQAAQQDNRTPAGKYAEGRHGDPSTDIGLAEATICPRCDGPWGDDLTCSNCCDSDGNAYPVGQAGEPNDDEDDLARMRRAQEAQWGDVSNVREGSRTPWGSAQAVYQDVPGVARVGTAGHGGIKLSPERNKVIPTALRNSSGWYEEDTESHIVAMYHPEAFPNYLGGDLDAIRESGRQGVMGWMPDEFEKATGETIPFGVSRAKDEATYLEAHRGEPCLYTTGAKEHPDYPGVVIVTTSAIGGHDGEWPEHMIPLADYQAADSNRKYGAGRINPPLPKSAIAVTPPATPKKVAVPNTGIDVTKAANHYKADAELDKDWREQGTNRIFNLRGDIAAGKFSGKHAYFNDGWHYSLEHTAGDSRVTPVTKALYDAYQGPDATSPADAVYNQYLAKSASVDRARSTGEQAKARTRQGEAEALRQQYDTMKAAERAAAEPARLQALADKTAAEKARHDAAFAAIVAAARI